MKKMFDSCFDECTFIILGATGNLSKRKLIPAMYKLIEDKKLCKFAIVGISIDRITGKELLDQAKMFLQKVDQKIWNQLEDAFSYHRMDFDDLDAYKQLNEFLIAEEKKKKLMGNRAFYFATLPHHFIAITKNLVESGIVNKKTMKSFPWTRLVYEKPFGDDLKSSQAINRYLSKVFDESSVFRIDHYLGKELVGTIALTRFTNRIFEPLWNNKHIDSVFINVSEKIDIEGRGNFYDQYGAIKDMIQSHMLQLLALTAMEQPKKLTAQYIRNAKVRVLEKIKVKDVLVGQYQGYKKEKGVKPSSITETFALVQMHIDNRRWKGVPFYVRTGKALDTKESYIRINFKPVACLLTVCPSVLNHLVIKISPDAGIFLGLNAKVPGIADQVTPVCMDFCYNCLFGPNTPEAYETLLADVMKGDQSAFVRADEVYYSWKVVEQILKKKGTLYEYKKGSKGPEVKK
ncbi:MAG: glucose-6-phosphate dehydrogenase [bacterium]